MKKFTSTDLGGAPMFKGDLKGIFNDELWDAIEAMLSPFDSDTEGIVVTGCVTTPNAGNFDMTAGIVYLNGELMRIAAATNQTYTKYIAPSTAINDTRTFQDSSSHVVAVTKGAELVGSAPGGQYITIAIPDDLDNRRLLNIMTNRQIATVFQSTVEALGGFRTEGSGVYIKTKVVEMGAQNFQAGGGSDTTFTVAHGITHPRSIRSISAFVRNDSGSNAHDLLMNADDAQINSPITANITFNVKNGGDFDDAEYSSVAHNRGWVTIQYDPNFTP